MVGLGGLEPPTSPLSGARSSHLSYRPQHRRGNVHSYLIVRWFSVFRKCVGICASCTRQQLLRSTYCARSLESKFRLSRRVQPAERQDVLAQPGSAVFSRRSDQTNRPQRGRSKINSKKQRTLYSLTEPTLLEMYGLACRGLTDRQLWRVVRFGKGESCFFQFFGFHALCADFDTSNIPSGSSTAFFVALRCLCQHDLRSKVISLSRFRRELCRPTQLLPRF
jgi:hypothetical protein